MASDIHQQIREAIAASTRVLIVSHVRPDGDAIGALLAIGSGIRALGKEVQMVLTDGVPGSARHLAGAESVVRKADGEFDLKISVDASDFKRTGTAMDGYGKPDINIDHHVTNDRFGRLNFIEPEAPATCAILAEFLPVWGMKITKEIADALLTGILTDTLGFRTSSTKSKTLRQAADLIDMGVDIVKQYDYALLRRSFNAARYWGEGLNSLERNDRMVWGTLSLKSRESVAYPGNDDADLINVISSVNGFDISLIFVEQKNGTVKVSWRSAPGIDVSNIAKKFGGGGHPNAAGADIPGSLHDIQKNVLQATEAELKLYPEQGID